VDLARPVIYRGITLNDAASTGPGGGNTVVGMRLTRVSYSIVSTHGYTEKNALKDGMSASDVFMGIRRVDMAGEVYGEDKAELFDRLALLRYALTPTTAYAAAPADKGYLPLTFFVPTAKVSDWPTGYIQQSIRCRPIAQPEWMVTHEAIDSNVPRGFVIPVSMGFEAKDPLIYHPTRIVEYFDGTADSGSLRNRGTYPTPLNFVLRRSGSLTGSCLFVFVGMGANMSVTIPADTVDRYVIVDSANRVVYYDRGDGPELRMDLIDTERASGYTWPTVPPTPEGESASIYSWTATAPLDALSEMSFYEAWA
jgi:hypothetical protein